HYLSCRTFFNLQAEEQAVSPPHTGEQKPKLIKKLGGTSDGRPRIARRVLLLDGDCGRDPVNQIHVRLLDTFEKLPRISRQRFYIPTLSLCVNRIEGERRLTRTRHAGHNGQ